MKTIYLLRHSEPDKMLNLENKEIPLSINGKKIIDELSQKIFNNNIDEIWSSTYQRAIETAEYVSKYNNNLEIKISPKFNERKLGKTKGVAKEFWLEQLYNETAKAQNGESREEVSKRMQDGINDILESESKNIIIVSHGTAITFFLMKYCNLKEAFLEDKKRHLTFKNKTIINDSFKTPEIFKLCFDQKELISVERIEY